MNYQRNKLLAKTKTTKPSLTDQAGARETDINVIVKQFTVSGRANGTTTEPMYQDFSELPRDLRGFIEMGRGLTENAAKLPKQLRDLAPEELFSLTKEQITAKLTPPQPEATKDEQK